MKKLLIGVSIHFFNMKQEKALKILKSGRNVFLTGIAGAGKTFVLMKYIEYLQKKKISFAVTASTGIVAAAIDGRTIHSFSGLGIRDTLNKNDIERFKFNKKILERIRPIKVLIIDEISMLSANQLDCVNAIFKAVRNNDEPFGGVQVVFCGDFLQLPPVKGDYAFRSMVWSKIDLAICYLDQAFRQKDSDLLLVLNAIRKDEVTNVVRQLVDRRISAKIKDFTVLFTHNEDVDLYNSNELKKVKSKSSFYKMWSSGDLKAAETIKRSCLSPENLEVKVGAKVMVTKNLFKDGLVNGTLATVTKCSKNSVEIKTLTGKTIELKFEAWSILNIFGKPIASIHQIPLRLAYAITIHKSQGMTLDAAIM
jgi:ATP-dependent exoDNAse (exonuclease V) alpha subunit